MQLKTGPRPGVRPDLKTLLAIIIVSIVTAKRPCNDDSR